MLAAPGMRRPRWAFMPVFRFPPAPSGGCAQVSTLPTIYLRRLLWRFFLDTLSWFCIACRIACAIVFVVLGYCASEKAHFLSENALSLLRTPGAGGLVGGRQGQRARTPDAARAEPPLDLENLCNCRPLFV